MIKCKNCGKEVMAHSKELCTTCYKRLLWKPKCIECKRCKRKIPHHARGLCAGCYNFVFHLKRIKGENATRYHSINSELYKELTKRCILCGFEKVVELHHLDENRKNNSTENLIGLCPNHHKMLHYFKFRAEMRKLLEEKGFVLPKDEKLDFVLDEHN